MNFKKKIRDFDIFIFIDDINKLISLNIKKFQKINLIYNGINYNDKKFKLIREFCAKKNINLFTINEYKVAIRFKLAGMIITHDKKGLIYPIFFTKKYSVNYILGIIKFSLISNNWNTKIYALGGIDCFNFKKLKNLKINGLGFQSFENKKKAHLLLSRRAF